MNRIMACTQWGTQPCPWYNTGASPSSRGVCVKCNLKGTEKPKQIHPKIPKIEILPLLTGIVKT